MSMESRFHIRKSMYITKIINESLESYRNFNGIFVMDIKLL